MLECLVQQFSSTMEPQDRLILKHKNLFIRVSISTAVTYKLISTSINELSTLNPKTRLNLVLKVEKARRDPRDRRGLVAARSMVTSNTGSLPHEIGLLLARKDNSGLVVGDDLAITVAVHG